MRFLDWRVVGALFVKASSLQRKRATLTVAAIAWGTVAIIMLLSFGEGLKIQLMKGRRGMGENIAVWWPDETSKVWQGLPEGRPIRPRMDDIAYLRGRMTAASGVIGEMTSWSSSMTYGTTTITGRVTGANWEYGEMRHHFAQAGGRFFNANDEREKRRVIFLGDALAKEIFGDADPVGETMFVDRVPYLVIGVLQHKMQMGTYKGPDEDGSVIPDHDLRRAVRAAAAHQHRLQGADRRGHADRPRTVQPGPGGQVPIRPERRAGDGSLGHRRGRQGHGQHHDRSAGVSRHHRGADPAHRRHRGGQHHVRRRQGEDARDRGADGPRRPPRLGDRSLCPAGSCPTPWWVAPSVLSSRW